MLYIHKYNGTCKCVHNDNITEFTIHDELWCGSNNCSITLNSTDNLGHILILEVKCYGMALSLSQQYFGTCNYHPYNEFRDGSNDGVYTFLQRSYLNICKDNRYGIRNPHFEI